MTVLTIEDAKPIGDAELPNVSGCYVLFVRLQVKDNLGSGVVGSSLALYVGKAEKSIRKRVQGTHLVSDRSGSSTVRRSIGALLREVLHLRPVPRSSNPDDELRFTNYAFDKASEQRLTEWIAANILVAPLPSSRAASMEKTLIQTLQPPLNLQHWNNPARDWIMQQRAACARMAECSVPDASAQST